MKPAVVVLIVLFAVAAGWLIGSQSPPGSPESGTVTIRTQTLTQIKTVERIVRIPTDPKEVGALVDELNLYRQSPGWITCKGRWVYAGLVAREWMAEYQLPEPPRWQAGLVAGPGVVAAAVSYRLGPVWAGGILGYGIAAGSVGMQW